MIRHHIAQRTGRFIECAAMLDADGFRHGDLHVIDIVVVPQRFEESVGEAKRQDVLHGFFAEIVIDSVDLILVQTCANLAIERVRRFQIVTERLFDDHSSPMPVGFFGEFRAGQLLHDLAEKTWRHRGVEQIISRRPMRLVDCSSVVFRLVYVAGSLKSPDM